MYRIGIDLGGTNIAVGVVDECYNIVAQVSVPTADIGLAQLAMHSCYETAAVSDAVDLEKAMAAYYGTTLEATAEGYTLR